MTIKADAKSIEMLDDNVTMDMAQVRWLSFQTPKFDEVISGGETIKVAEMEFNVMHTPGHTLGFIYISMIESDGKKAIYTGDTASIVGKLGFINGPGFDLTFWKASVKKLLSENPNRIYPSHNTFMLSKASEDLKLTDANMNAPWTTIITSVG